MFEINFQSHDDKTNVSHKYPAVFHAKLKKKDYEKGTQFKLLFVKDMSQFLPRSDKAVQFPLSIVCIVYRDKKALEV